MNERIVRDRLDGELIESDGVGGPPPAPALPIRAPRTTIDRQVAIALQVLLGIAGILAVGLAVSSLYRWRSVNRGRFERGEVDANAALLQSWMRANEVSQRLFGWFVLDWLVVLVLFIVWTSQLHGVSRAVSVHPRRWSSPWAVGGWFVPVANLIIPRLVLNEIETIVDGQDEAAHTTRAGRSLPIGQVWWLLLVAATVSLFISMSIVDPKIPAVGLPGLYLVLAVSMVTWTASCAAGVSYVRRLTRRANEAVIRHDSP